MKSIFSSKTFWIAMLQAVIGALVIFSSTYPDIGAIIIAKSLLDIFLRFVTSEPIKLS